MSITTAEKLRQFSLPVRWNQLLARYGEYLALGLLIVIVSVINFAWLWQDTRPLANINDANLYLRAMLHAIDRIQSSPLEVDQFLGAVKGMSISGRPPLYQLVTMPFIWLFGRSVDTALSVNLVFYAVLIVSTYGIGKIAQNGRAGLLGALIVASYPPIVHLSRVYSPVFAAPAAVAFSLWILLLLLKTRSVKIAWLFGASLAFGILLRPHFVVTLGVPSLVFGIYMLLFQVGPKLPSKLQQTPTWLLTKLREPFAMRGLLPVAFFSVLLIVPWLLVNGSDLMRAAEAVTNQRPHTIGFGDISPSFYWYAQTMPGAISNVFTFLFVVGLVAGILKWRILSSVLVIAFLATYIGFSSLFNSMAWWIFAAVLPVTAALTAIWIGGIRNKLIFMIASIIVLAVAFFNFSIVTWGAPAWSQPIATGLGAPLDSETCLHTGVYATVFCPNPPKREDWEVSDIIRDIVNDSGCSVHECSDLVMVVTGHELFNESLFDYYLVQDFPDLRLITKKSGSNTKRQPYNISVLLNSDYIVYVPRLGETLSGYGGVSTAFLQSPPAAFGNTHSEIASFELPRQLSAKLIKRTAPLTVEEAEISIASLELTDEAKSPQWFVQVGNLYDSLGDLDKAVFTYRNALQVAPDSKELHLALADAYVSQAQSNPDDNREYLKLAEMEYGKIIALDRDNSKAQAGLKDIMRQLAQ